MSLLPTSFSKILLTTEKKTNMVVVFKHRPLLINILNTENTGDTF